MTSPWTGFIKAIVADPDDDIPRLVFADWLEERGERPEWAELIRVQCGHIPYEPERYGQLARAFYRGVWGPTKGDGTVSWSKAGPTWAAKHVNVSPQCDYKAFFRARRGFICEVRMEAGDWIKHARQLLCWCPIRNASDGFVTLIDQGYCIHEGIRSQYRGVDIRFVNRHEPTAALDSARPPR